MNESVLNAVENSRYKAMGMQVIASVLWSFGGLLIKLVELNPLAIAGIRSLIAVFVIFPFLKRPYFKFNANKVIGAFAYTALVILFITATKLTTAASAILIQYTAPIYIAILGGWLLKEKASLRDWITIVFVVAGMILFFMDGLKGGNIKGNLIAALSGVAMALNTIFMRRQKDADPLENVFLGSILTFIVTIPFIFKTMPSTKSWIGLILLGVFQIGLSYVIYARAIKKITALDATFISLIEPLLNPVWVFLTIGEIPGELSIIGGIIVLVSITISCLKKHNLANLQDVKKNSI